MISPQNSPFKFITITDAGQLTDALMQDLLNEKVTGILIKDFLNEQEVQTALQGIKNQDHHEKTKINEGFYSYPLTFAQFTQLQELGELTLSEYCDIASKLIKSQEQFLGIDLVQKLCDFLLRYPTFGAVSPIIEKQSGKQLVPFTIRELLPGKGELIIHCENLFFNEFPRFFELLQAQDIKDNKLSYFLTLNAAQAGGELCCFDINWSRVKKRLENELLEDEDKQTIDIVNDVNVQRHFIKPEPGDLLLFAGGNVWHRVEKVGGEQSRITLGGFIAETTTPDKYYIWS